MLEQQLPLNVNLIGRPTYARVAGIARNLDPSDDRSSGKRIRGASPDIPAYSKSPPVVPFEQMEAPATGWWWAAMAFFMEGFALYGASLYPSAVFTLEEASLPANVHQARLVDSQRAIAQGQGVSPALNGSNVIAPGLAAWTEQPQRDRGDWLAGLGEKIVAVWTRWRREQEIRTAIRALAEYDDRTLRDLGIQGRADIERMVRYCRDC